MFFMDIRPASNATAAPKIGNPAGGSCWASGRVASQSQSAVTFRSQEGRAMRVPKRMPLKMELVCFILPGHHKYPLKEVENGCLSHQYRAFHERTVSVTAEL